MICTRSWSDAERVLRQLAEAQPQPPGELWARIEQVQTGRRQRRRRLIGTGAVVAVAVLAVLGSNRWHPASAPPPADATAVDWQSRAQALEGELRAIEPSRIAAVAHRTDDDTDPAGAELADLDRRLQSAYQRSGSASDLAPLWKRRSELLAALIAVRKERLTLTRI